MSPRIRVDVARTLSETLGYISLLQSLYDATGCIDTSTIYMNWTPYGRGVPVFVEDIPTEDELVTRCVDNFEWMLREEAAAPLHRLAGIFEVGIHNDMKTAIEHFHMSEDIDDDQNL